MPSEYARLCSLGALGPQGESPVNTTPKGKEALHTASISVWALGRMAFATPAWPIGRARDHAPLPPLGPSGLLGRLGGIIATASRGPRQCASQNLILIWGPPGRGATDKGAELPTTDTRKSSRGRGKAGGCPLVPGQQTLWGLLSLQTQAREYHPINYYANYN